MGILNLLFPDKCVFCGKLTDKSRVCEKCRDALPETTGRRTAKSGEFFNECIAPFYYLGIVRDSILRFKFHGKASYAQVYARYCSALIRERLSGKFDIITWVPVSRRRKRKRRYDQAELLAKAISFELGVPCVKTLKKIRHTPPQSTFTEAARRRANVSGAFRWNGNEIQEKRILLIDDIITTGATMSECARVLLMAGAEDVLACTVAMKKNN